MAWTLYKEVKYAADGPLGASPVNTTLPEGLCEYTARRSARPDYTAQQHSAADYSARRLARPDYTQSPH